MMLVVVLWHTPGSTCSRSRTALTSCRTMAIIVLVPSSSLTPFPIRDLPHSRDGAFPGHSSHDSLPARECEATAYATLYYTLAGIEYEVEEYVYGQSNLTIASGAKKPMRELEESERIEQKAELKAPSWERSWWYHTKYLE
ncbi:hypothetical protein KQX54_020810 [Cotesia glomerata]|uniref:Uncharacterized protein n=1 Tax=Cotesia glomerata TaxID=32391 RepID=A0AAV7HMA8_COTGL|nr:hypothetical protein KQX54_020810 [Cotesia glomerata]